VHCWYVGDSTTDVVAAKRAGVTAIFYNGVGWDAAWIRKIFPRTPRHPHGPDAIVRDLPTLLRLARAARA
jgi:phosphoglycolate phosphatase